MNSKKLKQVMDKKGISQRELARLSGVAVSTINFAYNGTQLNQVGDTIKALEKALGLKKGTLL